MLVSGEIENVPLLEVLQVVSYSKQTGVLSVESASGQGGALLFDGGGIVCADSACARALLVRAAAEPDARTRLALRRVQALAALTELLALRSGGFRFRTLREPLPEVGGVSTRSFYEGGAMDTGELLVVLATAIDKKEAASPAPPDTGRFAREKERSHPRYAPTVIPATLESGGTKLEGHLTNLSEGGTFFHGETLPAPQTQCRLFFVLPGDTELLDARVRVAWARAEGRGVRKGAGLSFDEMRDDVRAKVRGYLARYQRLADEVSAPVEQSLSS